MKVGYCRVSTKEQSNQALEQQKERIKREGVELVIVDVESGYKEKERKGLEELRELVKQKLVHEVVITRLDRLGRSVLELNKLVKEFQQNDCVIKALDDNIDMNTVDGRLHFNLLASFAQSESDRLSERIKHGIQHSRAKLMNPPPLIPFGYQSSNGKYILDVKPFLCTIPDRQEYSKYLIARKIVEEYLSTKSLSRTQDNLIKIYGQSFLSYQGLKSWLPNPVLSGHTKYKNSIYYNTHEPIISPSEASNILLTKQQSKVIKRHTKKIHPYSGKLVCAKCGSNFIVNAGIYYQCKRKKIYKDCDNGKPIRSDLVDQTFIQELVKLSSSILPLIEQEKKSVESPEIIQLKSQRDALLSIPPNPAIDRAIQEINNQIQCIEISNSYVHDQKLLAVLSSPLFWETLNPSDKKNIVWLLVDKILILDGNVRRIHFKGEYENTR
ncbi:recombinase family protein [Cyanobacterium aponinum UTEX 3222]|uniref:recombinase family protein n=1 Tax=Cyanobacterium aponinum TaxID=379064 RepID=UPI00308E76FE|nr:recombinase family protein [Cyanobacterium aponinum UTEX 3222]